MNKPESVLENETHKILWDFEIQMDYLIHARRPYLVLINKKKKMNKKGTYRLVDFAISANHWVKIKENEKRDKYLDLALRIKKAMENEGESDTPWNWCA